MRKIIFVCTGNTCRSPMAEAIARDIFSKKNIDIEVCSRGVAVYFPAEATTESSAAISAYGLSLSGHRATQITLEDVKSAELILAMTSQHKAFVKQLSEDNVDSKVFTLKEYIRESDMDITDPYGGDLCVYKACLEALYLYISRFADLLQ